MIIYIISNKLYIPYLPDYIIYNSTSAKISNNLLNNKQPFKYYLNSICY